jgi:hypothetical protein
MTLILNGICRIFALLTGWSPSGRNVEFRLAEAPSARLMARSYVGRVDEIQVGEHREKALLLSLGLPSDIDAESEEIETKQVLATPRYRGDTVYRLLFGSLLVNLADAGPYQNAPPRLLANGQLRIAEKAS